jgi:putative transposase
VQPQPGSPTHASPSLQGIPQKKRWHKKTPEKRPARVASRLVRDFQADLANTKWVIDIMFIETAEGWLYLSAVKDLHSDAIVG